VGVAKATAAATAAANPTVTTSAAASKSVGESQSNGKAGNGNAVPTVAEDPYIHMDCMAFGMGMCCLVSGAITNCMIAYYSTSVLCSTPLCRLTRLTAISCTDWFT
jgi:hypothetical protein